MIYLAAPYSHPEPMIVQERMENIYRVLGEFIKNGQHVITPLSMHEVAIRHDLDGTYDYWSDYCLDILGRCDSMVVLCMDGWRESRGVTDEIQFCENNDIPISYLDKE